jgi:NAD(P) transhydrogenase subunit beta
VDTTIFINIIYVISAALFIFGLKLLGHPATARKGNRLSAIAMLIAIIVTLLDQHIVSYSWIIISLLAGSAVGVYVSKKV